MSIDIELVKKLREESGAGLGACQKALKEADNDYDKAYDILRKQGASKALSKSDRIASEGLCCIQYDETGYAVVKLNCETDFVAKNENFQNLILEITKVALRDKTISIEKLLESKSDDKTIKDLITENITKIGENLVIGSVDVYEKKDDENISYYVHNCVEGKKEIGRIVSIIVSRGEDNEESATLLKQINMHITAMSPIALSEDKIPSDVIERERAIYKEQVDKLNKPADIANKMIEGKMRKFYEESVLLKQIFVLDNKNNVANVIKNFNKEKNNNIEIVNFKRISIK